MTKQEFIELIIMHVNGGQYTLDAWKKAHPKVVEKYVSLAVNEVMSNLFKNTTNDYDVYGKWYSDISVFKEDNRYYSTLPASHIQIKDKGKGILKITPTEDDISLKFLPSSLIARSSLQRLGTINRQGIVSYTPQNGRVLYGNIDSDVTAVDMFLIRPFEDYTATEEFPIPAEKTSYIINFCLKYLESQPIDTDTTDNNANS